MTKKIRGNVRWAFDEARRVADCAMCEAEAGKPCVDRKGWPIGTVHVARVHAYREFLGEDDFKARHTTVYHPKGGTK